MGEISEMMLDGTLCEGCGEYIDDDEASGFPRYCSKACAEMRGAAEVQIAGHKPTTHTKRKRGGGGVQPGQPVAKQLVKRLKYLAGFGTSDGSLTPQKGESMYAGDVWDLCRSQYERLQTRGFVERRAPHNPIHKDRAVITEAGLAFLRERGEIK